jgi:hypothetical protein
MRTLKDRTRRRHRVALAFLFAVTPTLAMAWSGCSSDNKSGGGSAVNVDPGGTFGAEIAVTVIGRGRVITTVGGLNCPQDCFASYVFKDRSEPGAAGGITLKAIPTPGIKFLGWKFDTAPLGSRGRGPENCNPVKRDSTAAAVNLNAEEIMLPFGEVQGAAPPGQEGFCVGVTTVPSAYNITATFENEVFDASVVDGDAEGGSPDIFLEPPAGLTGYQAKEIGILNGTLYVRYQSPINSTSVIASSTSTPGGFLEIISGSSAVYTAFEIAQTNAGHVVWQTSSGTIGVLLAGSISPQTFSSGGNTCVAVESDFSNVYCRTAGPNGSLISWTTAGTSQTTLHTGLPSGTELAVDSSRFYLSDTTNGFGSYQIRYVSKTATPDAGVPTFSDSTSAVLTNPPFGLEVNSSRLLWIDYSTGSNVGIAQSISPTSGGSPFSSTPSTQGLKLLATDPNSSLSYFAGIVPSTATGVSSIVRLSASSTLSTMVRQGLTNVGGIAADSSYVYWTQSDGRVYRVLRSGF